jgi:ketosteroid isomerase-like protein
MKKLIVLVLLLATACTHVTRDIQAGDAGPAIRRMSREFAEAANAGNVDGMMTMYASDAVLMPPNAPEFRGAASIRQFWSGLIGAKPKVTLTPVTILESCEMATELGRYELTIGPMKDEGKYVVTWRRTNGDWRAVADIFNSNKPPQM